MGFGLSCDRTGTQMAQIGQMAQRVSNAASRAGRPSGRIEGERPRDTNPCGWSASPLNSVGTTIGRMTPKLPDKSCELRLLAQRA
jgi:hypothetical protein